MKHKLIAIIPARGGSKGILRKNLSTIGTKALIDYSIEFALGERCFDEVIVSSDDDEILKHILKYKGIIRHKRSDLNSHDHAYTEDALREIVNDLKLFGSNLTLIEPTFPFRRPGIVPSMVELYWRENADCCVCIKTISRNPYNIFTVNQKSNLTRILKSDGKTFQRQQFEYFKRLTNGIYVFNQKSLEQFQRLTDGKLVGYLDEDAYDINIDTYSDLDYARYLIERGLKIEY